MAIIFPAPLNRYLPLTGGTLAGDLLFTDATYDIGKSGATRPRDGFFSRNLVAGTGVTIGAGSAITSSGPGGALVSTAFTAIGTSGATVPLLDGNNTYSGSALFTGAVSWNNTFQPATDLGANVGASNFRVGGGHFYNLTAYNSFNVPGAAIALATSAATFTSGAGAQVGTLTNAPAAGNPTSWIKIVDNGTTRYIPAW